MMNSEIYMCVCVWLVLMGLPHVGMQYGVLNRYYSEHWIELNKHTIQPFAACLLSPSRKRRSSKPNHHVELNSWTARDSMLLRNIKIWHKTPNRLNCAIAAHKNLIATLCAITWTKFNSKKTERTGERAGGCVFLRSCNLQVITVYIVHSDCFINHHQTLYSIMHTTLHYAHSLCHTNTLLNCCVCLKNRLAHEVFV